MSAPVPLNSGCCAPPCPNNPQTAVPGPAGENAFSFTVGNFIQPAVNANVTVTFTHDGWITPGQPLFIQGGGFYTVVSVSGLTAVLTNLGVSGNASPGVTINTGAQVSPGGVSGVTGNAYTTTTANFTQPAVNAQVNVAVVQSAWAAVGQFVFVSTGGTYTVFSVPDSTHMTLTNLGYAGNAAPATNIVSPQMVSPAGQIGPTGSGAGITLNSLSPTTTKGDIIVDNGSNHPLASDIRFGVGTDGQVLGADSAQAAGINWVTTAPTSVATTGDIAIFNGTTGKPVPLQDSKMLITTDGALQSTPSGGNARGTKAIDLQVQRSANTMVASGNEATIGGGQNNTASGTSSTVSGGNGNAATNVNDHVGGGINNTASGGSSACCGGNGNTASGQGAFCGAGQNHSVVGNFGSVAGGDTNTAFTSYCTVPGGQQNNASGTGASVLGGQNNTAAGTDASVVGGIQGTAYLWGQIAHASGRFAAQGDSQTSELIWRISTTDATGNVEAFLDGSSARAVIPLNNSWFFIIHTLGRSSAGVCAAWETKGVLQNVAGTVTLTAAVSQSVIADGTGGTWGVTANHVISADNVNKSLKVAVTGAVATNIRWTTHARLVEVNF